ncbi:MAG: DUF393 domain-containing protein [Hyphomicrobiales bacterium]
MNDLNQTEVSEDKEQISIFYDGSCPLCVREIGFLQRSFKEETVNWQNIASVDDADAAHQEVAPGLSRQLAMKRFHIRNEWGELVSGAGAFVTIWKLHPRFGRIANLLDRQPILWCLDMMYNGFLIIRPALQKLARKRFSEKSG